MDTSLQHQVHNDEGDRKGLQLFKPQLSELIESLRRIGQSLEGQELPDWIHDKLGELARLAQRIRRQHPPKQVVKKTSAETVSTDPALARLNEQQALVRDRVRGVAKQGQAGFYLYGRAGTSKTYTVLKTLEELGVKPVYVNGHITPIGLFEEFEKQPDSIFVLDDVGEIFKQPTAKGILLAALGSQPNGVRTITYRRHGHKTATVNFRGGVIAISNLKLHGDELIAAIKSRVQTLNYNPTDEQVSALMRAIAAKGHQIEGQQLARKDCETVCEFLLDLCKTLNIKPDVRMLVDKAFKDFLLWKTGESETHWHDLINSALGEQLVNLSHPVDLHVPTKKEEEAAELDQLEEIVKKFPKQEERSRAFMDATGKTLRTFQRRMKQLKTMGRLPKRS